MNLFFSSTTYNNADQILQSKILSLQSAKQLHDQFVIRHQHRAYYLPNAPIIELTALFVLVKSQRKTNIYCSILRSSVNLENLLTSLCNNSNILNESISIINDHPFFSLAQQLNAPLISISNPLILSEVDIEKPWGKECWLTGIEARGQSKVTDSPGSNKKTPLPWLIDLLPQYFSIDKHTNPILLKILDPLPDEVYGDLYFEMHQQKQEVYVVTHIDLSAWPDGVAKMRYGFNQKKLRSYPNENHFKNAFCKAVKNYQRVRVIIDEMLDQRKLQHGIALNDALSPEVMQNWLSNIPKKLIDEELALRNIVESFIGHQELQIGDVIAIAKNTPHSLMHGVRTIEFQTPVYERQILFFAQKVLTQDHWDTEDAMAHIDFTAQPSRDCHKIFESNQFTVDKIVDYPQFEVYRYTLKKHVSIDIKMDNKYNLLINVKGFVKVGDIELQTEQACYISPAITQNNSLKITNSLNDSLIFLLARPK